MNVLLVMRVLKNVQMDPDVCTECVGSYDEPSCLSVCPVDAIVPDPDNMETMEELRYKFETLQKGE